MPGTQGDRPRPSAGHRSMFPLAADDRRIRPERRSAPRAQLQPLVLPQLGQAWHEPARFICTPHCMHIGASL